MTKKSSLKLLGGDTPLWELRNQGYHWESLRADYYTRIGALELAMDATAKAEHHRSSLEAMPEFGHRYTAPQLTRFS